MPGSRYGHRVARALYPVGPRTTCEACGGRRLLQHHHRDGDPGNNAAGNVAVLCQACHTAAHMKTGTWGRRLPVAPQT